MNQIDLWVTCTTVAHAGVIGGTPGFTEDVVVIVIWNALKLVAVHDGAAHVVTEGFVKTIGFHTSSFRLRGGETGISGTQGKARVRRELPVGCQLALLGSICGLFKVRGKSVGGQEEQSQDEKHVGADGDLGADGGVNGGDSGKRCSQDPLSGKTLIETPH